ncbi:MAG: hypothetical protein PHV02_12020 [Rhodocyclaceae bacterium]|nr:hypothetical protein [Rhodocyclaceae bacterium]
MRTIEAKTINDATLITRDEVAPVGNYEPVRFNAMKHGILSRLVVLAHENYGEFAELLAALIEEHKPSAMTEQHLVEELAAIIWRKRRVLLAEGAEINRGLRAATKKPGEFGPAAAAAPFERGLSVDAPELAEMMSETAEQTTENQQQAAFDLAATDKAKAILRKSGPNAYERALRVLTESSKEWWEEEAEEGNYQADAEGLAKFITDKLWLHCYTYDKQARYTPAIQVQTLGEGLQAQRLEKLNRYETHLDRKFERTLAMLLKLKLLRGV